MNKFLYKSYWVCLVVNLLIGFVLSLESVQKTLGYSTMLFFLLAYLILPFIEWKLIMVDTRKKIPFTSRFIFVLGLSFSVIIGNDIRFLISEYNSLRNGYLLTRLTLLGLSIIIGLVGTLIQRKKWS